MEILGWALRTILVCALMGLTVAVLLRLGRIWLRQRSHFILLIVCAFGALTVLVTWAGLTWLLAHSPWP
jgi:hypothetical protein